MAEYYVPSWEEANKLVKKLTEGGTRALGAGNSYPEDFTLHAMDSWSGEGSGYRIWKNEDGRHQEIFAVVNIGRPPDYRLEYTYLGDNDEHWVTERYCEEDGIFDCIQDMRSQGMDIVGEKIMRSAVDPETNKVSWNEVEVDVFPDYL